MRRAAAPSTPPGFFGALAAIGERREFPFSYAKPEIVSDKAEIAHNRPTVEGASGRNGLRRGLHVFVPLTESWEVRPPGSEGAAEMFAIRETILAAGPAGVAGNNRNKYVVL